jgi:hypothetical protein
VSFYRNSIFLGLDKESSARGIISLFGRSNDTRVLAAPRKQLGWTFVFFFVSIFGHRSFIHGILPSVGPDMINLTAAFPLRKYCAVVSCSEMKYVDTP